MNINETFRYLNIGLPEDILRHKMKGDFPKAIALIDQRLRKGNLPEELKKCMIVQREMIQRLPLDYPYTREEAIQIAQEQIPDFTEEEFDERVEEGKIGWIYVDGQMHFFNRFFETLCKVEAGFAKRAGITVAGVESAGKDSEETNRLNKCMNTMKTKGYMKNRIRIRAKVKVKDEEFQKGMFVRVHLPLPAACEQQSEIQIEKVLPETGKISTESAPQRTICWEEYMEENHEFLVEYSYVHKATYHDLSEKKCDENQPEFYLREEAPHIVFTPYLKALTESVTDGAKDSLEKAQRIYDFITKNMKYMEENHEFLVEYSYVHKATYHDLSEKKCDENQPEFYLREEAPHIVFTPYLKALTESVTDGAKDSLEKAQRIYDFITKNMKYTFMPAYFVLENIAEMCARNFTGDCGVFTLLFITMCRCAGVPAKWQSGLAAEPDFCGGHDWAQFYVAPYGWLYADTSYGISAVRAENEERRQFYFGNLDAYRMVANSEFQAPFTIEKMHWRADPYDNQVGEIETDQKGLSFEEYERSKEILLCEEIE